MHSLTMPLQHPQHLQPGAEAKPLLHYMYNCTVSHDGLVHARQAWGLFCHNLREEPRITVESILLV